MKRESTALEQRTRQARSSHLAQPWIACNKSTEALAQATSNRILKGGIYEMAKSGDPEMISGLAGTSLSGTSQGMNNAFNLLQTLRGQQAAIETQLAADTSKYGSANPKLGDERASLASTTAAINQEIKRIGERAKTDYRAAQITEKGLRADYEHQRASADQLNNKAVNIQSPNKRRMRAADSMKLFTST